MDQAIRWLVLAATTRYIALQALSLAGKSVHSLISFGAAAGLLKSYADVLYLDAVFLCFELWLRQCIAASILRTLLHADVLINKL